MRQPRSDSWRAAIVQKGDLPLQERQVVPRQRHRSTEAGGRPAARRVLPHRVELSAGAVILERRSPSSPRNIFPSPLHRPARAGASAAVARARGLRLCCSSFRCPALSPEAHRLAAVLAAVVVLWVTEALPLPVTALLGAAACVAAAGRAGEGGVRALRRPADVPLHRRVHPGAGHLPARPRPPGRLRGALAPLGRGAAQPDPARLRRGHRVHLGLDLQHRHHRDDVRHRALDPRRAAGARGQRRHRSALRHRRSC